MFVVFLVLFCWKCPQVICHQQPSTSLWSLRLMRILLSSLCQSRGGPVTEVEWRRNGVIIEEDSNHMTSQIIVNTSRNTVFNNTLRVRGRETGTYVCTVRHNAQDFFPDSDIQWNQASGTLVLGGKISTSICCITLKCISQQCTLLLASLPLTTQPQVSY